jgi:vacuolar-type H+-ATPase subunit E/Vma4
MGHKELIESLYREADKKVALLLKTAEAEAESIRSETAERIERLREDFSSREAAAAARDSSALTGKAEREAHAIVLSAEKELSERLRRLASSCLNELRNREYDAVFSALCRELQE